MAAGTPGMHACNGANPSPETFIIFPVATLATNDVNGVNRFVILSRSRCPPGADGSSTTDAATEPTRQVEPPLPRAPAAIAPGILTGNRSDDRDAPNPLHIAPVPAAFRVQKRYLHYAQDKSFGAYERFFQHGEAQSLIYPH